MKTHVITGANRGIGLALCAQLAARGDAVIGVCRQASPELRALKVHVETDVDMTRPDTLTDLARRLATVEIDRLILNAGVLTRESLDRVDANALAAIRHQFEVNALAPLQLAAALQGRVRDGGQIAVITSRMGSIADNGSGGYYGYRMSKAALNAAARSLAMDLKPRGIGVFALHPGFVKTNMTGGNGDVTPEQAAKNLIARMDGLSAAQTGSFWHANGEALPW